MRWRWFLPLLSIALATASSTTVGAPAPPMVGVIDRVIAVVGFDGILLSDLRARARVFLTKLKGSGASSGPVYLNAEAQIYREVLEKMVDERLLAAEAARATITVSSADIDAALQSVATQQAMTPAELLDAAKALGLSEKEYRDELARQLLEGKLIQLRVYPRIKGYSAMTETEKAVRLDEERRKYLAELRVGEFIEVRL